jgi:hypothetical protein
LIEEYSSLAEIITDLFFNVQNKNAAVSRNAQSTMSIYVFMSLQPQILGSVLAAAYFCKGIPNKDFCDCNLNFRVTRYFIISLLPRRSDL